MFTLKLYVILLNAKLKKLPIYEQIPIFITM